MHTYEDFNTSPLLAERIVASLPIGRNDFCLDPCRSDGAFYNALPKGRRDWCEIKDGRDFLTYPIERRIQWIITNPAWGRVYTDIARRSFQLADNVVFLTRIDIALNTYRRIGDWQDAGHGLREVHAVSWSDADFIKLSGEEKDEEGHTLAWFWWQRGYP